MPLSMITQFAQMKQWFNEHRVTKLMPCHPIVTIVFALQLMFDPIQWP